MMIDDNDVMINDKDVTISDIHTLIVCGESVIDDFYNHTLHCQCML